MQLPVALPPGPSRDKFEVGKEAAQHPGQWHVLAFGCSVLPSCCFVVTGAVGYLGTWQSNTESSNSERAVDGLNQKDWFCLISVFSLFWTAALPSLLLPSYSSIVPYGRIPFYTVFPCGDLGKYLDCAKPPSMPAKALLLHKALLSVDCCAGDKTGKTLPSLSQWL